MKKIQDLLTEKGFVEGKDYTLSGSVVTPILHTRVISPAVEEVKDEAGNIITPASPEVTEQYTDIPSTEKLMAECLMSVDAMSIVIHYMEGHTRPQGDLNLDLFLLGDKSGWRISNIPAPTIEHLYNMADASFARVSQEMINDEAEKYLDSTDKWVIRQLETGKPMPEGIQEKRAEARKKVVKPPKKA